MKKKLLLRLCLILTVLLSLSSCTNEDLYSSSENEKQEVTSKSPWKEDQVYIKKVQKIFLQNANVQYFERKYGTVHWDYAMSFGQFDESYLVVPILKGNTVITAMKVYRIDDRVYFREKNDPEFISFFTDIMFKEISGIDEKVVYNPTSVASKAIEYKCTSRTFTVGCPTGYADCEPLSYNVRECNWVDTGGNTGPTRMELCNPMECGGGGDGPDLGIFYPDPPEEKDPCKKATANNTEAKTLLDNSVIKNKKDSMTAKLSSDKNEKSFSFGKDDSGKYKTTDIITSTTGNSVDVKATSAEMTIEGGAHTHTSDLYNCFSAGDFYAFQGANTANSNFQYLYVFAADGTAYVLTITNPDDFAAFQATYPKGTYFDPSTGGWNPKSSIGVYFEKAKKQFKNAGESEDEAFEKATAMVAAKYKTGISLSKQDATGNFNSIFVKENTNCIYVGGIPIPITSYEKTNDCNL